MKVDLDELYDDLKEQYGEVLAKLMMRGVAAADQSEIEWKADWKHFELAVNVK